MSNIEKIDITKYGLICSINAEIEAMKAKNQEAKVAGIVPFYDESHFWAKAEELSRISQEY